MQMKTSTSGTIQLEGILATARRNDRTLRASAALGLALVASLWTACSDDTSGPFTVGGVDGVLTGVYTSNLHLTADKLWLLRGPVLVGDGTDPVILRIDPGTEIRGEKSTIGSLIINRNAQIRAEGTPERPIVFTSNEPEGSRARGDWGGVIINGNARINACNEAIADTCQAFGEGGTGFYGGDDDGDDSGVMRYVRIEFAGRLFSPDNELNGLALQGVGSTTVLEHIQVHMNADDGIEFFGGAADIKYALITGCGDDSLDWTEGWRGRGQFIVAQQFADDADNGIEADNNGDAQRAEPRAQPTLSNVTLIGSPGSEDASDVGVLLREGTHANLSNMLVAGFNSACIDIDGEETFEDAWTGVALNGKLTMTDSIISCPDSQEFDEEPADPFEVSRWFNRLNPGNAIEDPGLVAPYDQQSPDLRPGQTSPALTGAQVPDDPFFEQVTFRGGIDPNDDWTAGWTTSAAN
jgi:hypothetical protein